MGARAGKRQGNVARRSEKYDLFLAAVVQVSFIDLTKAMDHGLKEGALEPGDKLCPVMSRYDVVQAPMEAEPTLKGISVLCIREKCGMFNKCFNISAKTLELRNPSAA